MNNLHKVWQIPEWVKKKKKKREALRAAGGALNPGREFQNGFPENMMPGWSLL